MRNFKKFLTLVLAVMMVVSAFSFSTSAASQFTDVDGENEYLAKSVSLLNYVGVAKGVSETEFGTEQPVTRQQFALFVYRLMKAGKDAPKTGNNTTKFADLTDATYFYAISWANSQGIINGRSETSFDPNGTITLQEAYAMLVRALGYEKDGETLPYPHGYNEVAEQKGVALDEGLDSTINYTDALTRGDMAILLYNTFFAETGVAEVYNVETDMGDGRTVVKQVEDYPTLCEKVFDVKEVEYQAVATPHYAFDGFDVTDDLGYGAVLFQYVDSDNVSMNEVPNLVYVAGKDISVADEELDNYFMAHFTTFIKVDEDDTNEIESILFADSNMTKKTVSDIKLATVTTNKTTSYFDETDAKLLSGKATSGTDVFYFFDAPYSYANPTYESGYTDAEKYEVRNEDNVVSIAFALEDEDEGYYSAAVSTIADNTAADFTTLTELNAANATKVAEALTQVYYEGLYEADLYDVDGDGRFEYINYKPYAFFQVTTDDELEFIDATIDYADDDNLIPLVPTNGATLLGESFKDEDYVIGYFSQALNVVKVAKVVEPTNAKIKTVKGNNVVLTDGTSLNTAGAWKLVANYAPADVVYDYTATDADTDNGRVGSLVDLLNDGNIGETIEMYVYDGVVLYQTGATTSTMKFTDNLIIPVAMDQERSSFDSKVGDMVYYAKVYVDGTEKFVPVETEDVYPELVNGDDFDLDNYNNYYAGQLCTYSIDANGVYTIESLENAEDEDGENIGINEGDAAAQYAKLADKKDADIQYIASGLQGVTLEKVSGTRFQLRADNANGYDLPEYINLKSFSTIVIKNYDSESEDPTEYEYLTYGVSDFTNSMDEDVVINNVSILLSNDTSSTTRENLVVLYAEAEDFALKGAKSSTGYRIVMSSNVAADDTGSYRYYYNVLNPFTGEKQEDVPGYKSATKASSLTVETINPGSIVDLIEGKVDDRVGKLVGDLDAESDAGLVWIREYDSSEKVLDVVPVEAAGMDCWQNIDEYVFSDEGLTDPEGNEFASNSSALLYQVDAGTVVTLLKGSKNDDLFKYGSFKLLSAADLGSSSTDYRCYNSKVESNNSYKTGYAKYLKAYISYTESTDEDELPTVDYVVIIANNNEAVNMLTTHTNTAHADCAADPE